MKIPEPKDELDINSMDVAVKTGSGLLGAIPLLGPLMANMFEISIPHTRMERFADTIRRSESRIEDLEDFKEKMRTSEGMDFIEDVLTQTRTALTEERREYIANLFRNSINRDDIDHIHKKYLFRILSDLNDVEILYLKRYSLRLGIGKKHPFMEKHKDVFTPTSRAINATREKHNRGTFEDSFINHLDTLGLVEMESSRIKNARPTGLTGLGNLLLEYIEVPDD